MADQNFRVKRGLEVGIGATVLVAQSSGNIGINSTAPEERLTVYQHDTAALFRGNDYSVSVYTPTPRIRFGTDTAYAEYMEIGAYGSINNLDTKNRDFKLFSTAVDPILYAQEDTGNVGIGTDNPSQKLDVYGGRAAIRSIGGSSFIEVGSGQNSNQYAYIDFIGDTTYQDYGLRLLRGNGGANSWSELLHRGTGTFYLSAQDAGSISLRTQGTDRVRIDSSGNVGIGTDNPQTKLSVSSGGPAFEVYPGLSNTITLTAFDRNVSDWYDMRLRAENILFSPQGSEKVRITSSGDVGIGITNPSEKLDVIGTVKLDGLVFGVGTTVTSIDTDLTTVSANDDTLASAKAIKTYVDNQITAQDLDFAGGTGTGAVDLDSQSLTIAGTANEIETSASGQTLTIGLPNDVTIGQDLTVNRDVQINRNLNVDGNITIGGTSATLFTQTLTVADSDLVLGIRTDGLGNDISNDTTANHGGIAIASTEGNPLITIVNPGAGETLPATYKKIMWFKSGSFAGLGTDAWLSNYAIGIGSTQVPNGVRLAAGDVHITENDISKVRDIDASGIITATTFSGSGSGLTNLPASSIVGIVTDSNLLDGLDSTQFLRSDADDTATGLLTLSGGINVSGVSTFNGTIDIGTQKIEGGSSNYYIKVPNTAKAEFVSNRPIEIRADDDDNSDTEYLLLSAGQNELKVTSTAGGGTDANKLTYNGNIVWHAGNDGTGTGLDADTLDTLQATSFLRSDTDDTMDGILTLGGTSVSGNEGGELKLTQAPNSNLSGNQVVIDQYVDRIRFFEVGSPFKGAYLNIAGLSTNVAARILTTDDEGSGNGLDADTLDGIQASSFLRSDAADTGTGLITLTNGLNVTGGNVGIGTDNPLDSLHLSGTKTLLFGPNTNGKYLRIGADSSSAPTSNTANIEVTNGNLHIDSDDVGSAVYLNFYGGTNGTIFGNGSSGAVGKFSSDGILTVNTTSVTGTANQKLQVDGGAYVSGNLGVGATNPGAKLDVFTSGGANVIRNRTDATNNYSIFALQNTGASGREYHFGLGGSAVGGVTSGSVYLWDATDSAVRWYTDSSGNFVIGPSAVTGTANQKLQVNSGAYFSQAVGIGYTAPGFTLAVNGSGYFNTNLIGTNVLAGTQTLTGTANQKLQVDGGAYVSGNLGVGATNPTSRLEIYESTGTDLRLNTGVDKDNSITFAENGINYFRILHDGSGLTSPNNVFKIQTGTVSTGINNDAITIKQSGDVGIGTDSPSQKLDVNGALRLRGALYDGNNQAGSSGQVLSSTATGIDWVDAAPSNAIAGISIYDETSLVGTANSVSTLYFVGPNVTATSVGSAATITVADYVSNSGIATNLKGGTAGDIPYQTAADTTTFLADPGAGGNGYMLTWDNGNTRPAWAPAAPASAITGLSVRDEGSLQGSANSVTILDIVGDNVSAAVSSGIATITVSDTPTFDTLNVTGVSTFQGNVNLGDNDRLRFGDGNDLQIYHDATNSYIDNTTGDLWIRTVSPGDDINVRSADDITIQNNGGTNAAIFKGGAGAWLYYSGDLKFETVGTGVSVFGNLYLNDTNYLSSLPTGNYGSVQINGSGKGNWQGYSIDGRVVFMHDGSSATGLYNDVNNEWLLRAQHNAEVQLYYDGSKKFETASYGIYVTGVGNTSTIGGAANLVLDPSTVGDNTGTVTILGNLQVEGTQTIINSTTLEVDDKLVSIAKSATNATQADGAGLEINGASATLTYVSTPDSWEFNKDLILDTTDATLKIKAGATGTRGAVDFTFNSDSTVYGSLELDYDTRGSQGLHLNTTAYPITLSSASGQDIKFRTGTTERVRIEGSNGYVGINTTSPSYGLELLGSRAWFKPNQTGAEEVALSLGTYSNSNQPFYDILTNDATADSVTHRINRYTGTWRFRRSSPTGEQNAIDISSYYTSGTSVSIGNSVGDTQIYLYTNGNSYFNNDGAVLVGSATTTGTANQKLQVDGGAYVSGDLGVGITNPLYKLAVDGNLYFTPNSNGYIRGNDSSQNGLNGSFLLVGTAGNSIDAGIHLRGGQAGSVDWSIYQKGSDNSLRIRKDDATEPFVITNSGDVGIGTDNPGYKFEVYDDEGACLEVNNHQFRVNQTLSTWTNTTYAENPIIRWDFKPSVGDLLFLASGGNTATSDQMAMVISDGHGFKVGKNGFDGTDGDVDPNNEFFRITYTGDVGIGSTTPTAKLDVVGTVKATDFNTTSDQNLKTNIQTIENPLDKIVQIRGVNFEWKENNKPSAGVIAQEVEKVLPQLVNGEGTKTVNYNGLIGLLIEAVKAQQEEINMLKERLK